MSPHIEVKRIALSRVKSFILDNHYSGVIPPCVLHTFGLFIEKTVRGVVLYGLPVGGIFLLTNLLSDRGKELSKHVFELQRLSIFTDMENAASFLISHSLKMLPTPATVVSFADINAGHIGYVYQATNWLYTGIGGASEVLVDRYGQSVHVRAQGKKMRLTKTNLAKMGMTRKKIEGKHRYVMFLGNKRERKVLRRGLLRPILPYPKGDTRRHDLRGPEFLETSF